MQLSQLEITALKRTISPLIKARNSLISLEITSISYKLSDKVSYEIEREITNAL